MVRATNLKKYFTKYNVLKSKLAASNVESLREFKNWYNAKWARDYPEAYNMRWGRRRYGRRRLTKHGVVTPSPGRRKRARVSRIVRNTAIKKRQQIGERVGKANNKRINVFTYADVVNPTELNTHNITGIAKGTGSNDRLRDLINLRGFKFQMFLNSKVDYPTTWHIAVVAPKGDWDLTNATTAGNEFLRDYRTNDRATDVAVATSGLAINHFPINEDRFTVFKHKRVRLGPDNKELGYMTGVRQNWAHLDFYWPVKRQLRYNTELGGNCETPVYLCMWVETDHRKQAEAWSALGTYKFELRANAYAVFMEPK